MSGVEETSKLSTFGRHPLTAIAIGFLLTGVVGAWISSYYTNRQAEKDRKIKMIESRKEAVQKFARFVYERRTRASMLAASLKRKAAIEEVKERKNLYDEAYVQWGTNLQANLFLAREILEANTYSNFEAHIEHDLVPIYRSIDSCLTEAYDAKVGGENPERKLKECKIEDQLQLALDCGYAITDELFKLTNSNLIQPISYRSKQLLDADTEIMSRCKTKVSSQQNDVLAPNAKN